MVTDSTVDPPVFSEPFKHEPTERMQCMEVYGGNQFAARAIEFGGLDCWIYSKPYGDAPSGGDVFYASSCATGRITRLLLADVAGHGEAVSKLAYGLRDLMRRFVNHLDQGAFVRRLNDEFAKYTPSGIFATAIVATFFGPSRRLRLCNAGHPRPLLYRASTGDWELLGSDPFAPNPASTNIPLGILQRIHFEEFDIELEPGDRVLAYTDALSECCDTNAEMISDSGLLQVLRRIGRDVEPPLLIDAVQAELIRQDPSNLCEDDVTMVLISANGREPVYSLRERAGAVGRFCKAAVKALFHRQAERPPFPDLRLANIGGAIFPALGRRWRASGRGT